MFSAAEPALVFGIANDLRHGCVIDFSAVNASQTLCIVVFLKLIQTVAARRKALIQVAHKGRLRFVDDQSLIHIVIAVNTVAAVDTPILDSLFRTELHAGRDFPRFVLRDTRHDNQPQLAVRVKRIDVIADEIHADPLAQQLPCIGQRVQRIPGKTGNFFGQDQIELMCLSFLDHTKKLNTSVDACTRDTFVHKARIVAPVWNIVDHVNEVIILIADGGCLLVLIC